MKLQKIIVISISAVLMHAPLAQAEQKASLKKGADATKSAHKKAGSAQKGRAARSPEPQPKPVANPAPPSKVPPQQEDEEEEEE